MVYEQECADYFPNCRVLRRINDAAMHVPCRGEAQEIVVLCEYDALLGSCKG